MSSVPPPAPPPAGDDDDWANLPDGWDDVADDAIAAALDATRAAAAAAAPPPPPVVPPPGPPPEPWDVVARRVKSDTMAWVSASRQRENGLLVLKPSPGTGKTHSLIESAIDERSNGRRVGYAVFAKEQLTETKDRFQNAMPGVRLHVIHGRDESNCDEWPTVQAAQMAGYSPGATVCLKCPHYPRLNMLPPCEYYRSRIRAAKDYNRARGSGSSYPIILTTHASMVQSQHLTEHEYGTFWSFDTVIFDEDPSAALEKVYEVGLPQLVYQHPQLADYHTWMTTLLREAIYLADSERASAASRQWKLPSGAEDPTHSRWGSAYVSDVLHDLLARAMSRQALGALPSMGIHDAETLIAQTINNATDVEPESGEFAALPPSAIAKQFPHKALVPICEALDAEIALIRADRQNGLSSRFGYRVRLEFSPDAGRWQYICTDYTVWEQDGPNIIIGDAYAHVPHYEALFVRAAEVIDHRAKWPAEVLLIRNMIKATRREVEDAEPRNFFNRSLQEILIAEKDRSVLFYIHKKWRDDLEAWLVEKWDELGLSRFAIEHYGSGRGKDIYRDFNTIITVTEFIPSVAGLVHEANARAFMQTHYSDRFRVEHWQRGTPSARKGAQTFAGSTSTMDPRLLPIYQRKCVEELAQAVHRIRPAMPVRDTEKPKRVYIFGQSVQLNDELMTATTPMSFDSAADTSEVAYTLEPGSDEDRGKLVTLYEGPVVFVAAREMAAAIGAVYTHFGCWSPVFAHALLSLNFVGDFAELQSVLRERACRETEGEYIRTHNLPPMLRDTPRVLAAGYALLCTSMYQRVWSPPETWDTMSRRVCKHRVYNDAYRMFAAELPVDVPRGKVLRPWMPSRSGGREYVGNPAKFIAVIDQYAPRRTSTPVPF